MRAYELYRNPFKYKGSTILLDVGSEPITVGGQPIEYRPRVDSEIAAQINLTGLRFNRVIAEGTAVYDVMAYASEVSGDPRTDRSSHSVVRR